MVSVPLSYLEGFVPFQALDLARLQILQDHCARYYARKGQVLMEPGKPQTYADFLVAGSVKCLRSGEVMTPHFPYALHYRRQPQDVLVALTDCSLFRVERDLLDRFLCWSESVRYLEKDIAYQRQYDEQQEWMLALLNSNLFYKVSPLNLQKIFIHLSPQKVKSGDVIIKEGEVGDYCYFIKEGCARVTRKSLNDQKNGQEDLLASVGIGRCFGEDALIHETTRNATVTMETDGLLMKMEKRDFLQLLREPAVEMLFSADLDVALQTGAILLDVRTPEEYRYQHLKNAFSMPLATMRFHSRVLDTYGHYVVYCDTDRRSRAAAYFLTQLGYRVRTLQGGLNHLTPDHPLMMSAI